MIILKDIDAPPINTECRDRYDLFDLVAASNTELRQAARLCDACPIKEDWCIRNALKHRPDGMFQAGFAWRRHWRINGGVEPISVEQYIALNRPGRPRKELVSA